jgi:hypothetical protein
MKKQKKFGRKLTLNKETIVSLEQGKLIAGKNQIPHPNELAGEDVHYTFPVCLLPTLELTECVETYCLPCDCMYPPTY